MSGLAHDVAEGWVRHPGAAANGGTTARGRGLSFPDPQIPLGGMALAHETVFREAKAQKKPVIRHSNHLILHGFLHLLGYDHHSAQAARLMEGLEVAILSTMGIPNPYVPRARSRA